MNSKSDASYLMRWTAAVQSAVIPVARTPMRDVTAWMWETEDGTTRRSGTLRCVTTTQESEPRNAIPVRPEADDAALKAYSIW